MGHARDERGDLIHVAGLLLELEDPRHRLLHPFEDQAHLLDGEVRDVDARMRLLVALRREAEGLARVVGVALDGGGDVVDQAVRVVQQLLLLGHTRRQIGDGRGDLAVADTHVLCRARQFVGRPRHLVAGALHVLHQSAQVRRHALDAAGERVGLVREVRVLVQHHPRREVAAADLLGGTAQVLEGARQSAGEEEADRATHAESDEGGYPGRHGHTAALQQDRKAHHGSPHDQGAHYELVGQRNSHTLAYR